ncbi:DUF2269 domain-containing protein [Nocardia takedensis]|uniref:hypothetical protein n=1 Tax=Nocardia takedensis TaxID=259390 RepID=UPI0002D3ECE4|nr:hypothetical protein [Nocardia takedensis]
MSLAPRSRRFAVLVHIVSSVGWMGAIALYIALAVSVVADNDPMVVRGALTSMRIGIWYVIVPLAALSLLTGLVVSLGTSWGLVRHYWVIFKLVLNLVAVTVLVLYTNSIDYFADLASSISASEPVGALRNPTHLVHSIGGLVILTAAAVLSVYKPKGMTGYGQRRAQRVSQREPAADPVIAAR